MKPPKKKSMLKGKKPVSKSLLLKVGGQGIKNLDENDNKFLELQYNDKPIWSNEDKRLMRRYAKKHGVSPMMAGFKLGLWK